MLMRPLRLSQEFHRVFSTPTISSAVAQKVSQWPSSGVKIQPDPQGRLSVQEKRADRNLRVQIRHNHEKIPLAQPNTPEAYRLERLRCPCQESSLG